MSRVFGLAALVLAAAAARAEGSPWNLGAGIAFGHEDNLFRAPPGEASRVDFHTLSLSGGLDQTIGRQRLQAEASVRDNRYDGRGDLDNTGYGLQLGWSGATAGAVSWSLSHAVNRKLASYGTVLDAERRVANIETSRQTSASVQLGLVAQWIANTTLSRRSIDYSAEVYAAEQYRLDSAGLGLTWQPLGPLTVSFGPRFTRGRYPQARTLAGGGFAADGFDRRDIDLSLNWAASGASTLSARLSLTRQRYDLLTDRDFDGATGQLAWRWQATGKTAFNAALARDTGSETSFFTLPFLGSSVQGTGDNSTLTSTLVLAADHAPTAKLRLGLSGRYARRQLAASSSVDLGGDPVTLGSESGSERSGSVAFVVRYLPTPRSSVACELGHARRAASTTLSSPYRANSLSCSAQLSLR